jgi:hypothetical protein
MAGLFATEGSTIDIGQPMSAQSADFVVSDFDAQSWVNIGWAESLGPFGDQAAEITFDAIGEARTQKLKGVRNAGNMECTFGIDYEDEGQATVRGAETETYDYAFRVTFNDAPAGGTPSYRYFIAKVMQAREELGSANNVVKLMVTLGINSNIVRVSAAA